jgi:hypothetical protein
VSTFDAAINSRKFQKWFPWVAGGILLLGIAAALVFIVPNQSGTTASDNGAAPSPDFKPQTVPQEKLLKRVPPEARRVAGKFLLTAVQRKNLAAAWPLAGPQVRQGMTREQWLKGDIAVPTWFDGIKAAPMKVDYATKKDAQLEVLIEPTKTGKNVRPGLFVLTLDLVGKGENAHWVVNSAQQRVSVAIPNTPR